jgi:hypothetical protein
MLGRLGAILLAVVLSLSLTEAVAATLTVDTIDGTWGNSRTSPTNWGKLTGEGTSSIRWGVAASGNTTRSGYDFAQSGGITQTGAGSFLLGRYTHTNGTIWTPSTNLKRSDLSLNLTGTANGQAFSLSSSFRLAHDETPNKGVCPRGTSRPCGDLITISQLTGAPLVITQGTTVFTILIDGFVRKLGGPIITSLLTPENRKRSLYLQASVQVTTLPPPEVPLPAAAYLMAAGLGALALLRRRRRG